MLVGTLGPFEGLNGGTALVWTPEKEATRQAVNTYLRDAPQRVRRGGRLRQGGRATRRTRAKLKPEYDAGDHIHPNDAGSKAMAEAIPLNLVVR